MKEQPYVFQAYRLTHGNFFFPERILISHDSVCCLKHHRGGDEEIRVPISEITAAELRPGWLFSELHIKTAKGEPIVSNGYPNAIARLMQEVIDRYREEVTREVAKEAPN